MLNDLWYKNAIVYCLSVGSFMDANGDGVGDFKGLLRRLDYLQGLGVTTIWLMPFQPSPGRDNGYVGFCGRSSSSIPPTKHPCTTRHSVSSTVAIHRHSDRMSQATRGSLPSPGA